MLKGLGAEFRESARDNKAFSKKRTLHMYDFKKFKYLKTVDVHKRYKFTDKKLGQGAFGQVLVCVHNATGLEFAVKIMVKKQIEK